ncbi:MAG TPA: 2-succinyl-5-enolpyruvyl-6-hydroxy-3-cyclohexene-1-carboxylic-acid synthase [Streptosporangiaceae bacterium]|nr:2-succinyl-5-enolpyruvyl-6-hydroxy-3-cyclohexene-1-carboxylic-acid synthase [Streptosporangiaceae bacterium]
MNPATAFATALVDELARCGLTEAVVAPGSRNAPLAMALWRQATGPAVRLHVRIDERSAAFLALGLAKVSRRPVAVVCTSGTAAAHFHAAVIEADEACVPLLVLTADRPPELRGTGANQTVDQVKLYGNAVRWFCEVGVPEAREGMNAYWRSLACRAWASAAGGAGGAPGPVHLNLPLREPLVPDAADGAGEDPGEARPAATGPGGAAGWPEPLAGRPGGAPWTAIGAAPAGSALELPWTERGVVVCGDGCTDPAALLRLAEEAGWPVLAEPSSGARAGPGALAAYPFLLDSAEFVAAHRPDVIVSAGRPGLSRGQLAYLKTAAPSGAPPRHVVVAQGPGRWADPARTATDVAPALRLAGRGPAGTGWLTSWRTADAAARAAASAILDAGDALSEPRLARDLAAGVPDGALLWAASSLPIRDLDQQMAPRPGVTVLANRGVSGIDGLVSSAYGAALAHQRVGGGPAVALLGDLAFLHDLPGLFTGPEEPRPDLVLVVVNNDGGGIFSLLEQAAFPASFERVFGTPHGGALARAAAAAGIPAVTLERASGLAGALWGDRTPGGHGLPGAGIRIVEVPTSRTAGTALRHRLRAACTAAAGTR